MLQPPARQQQSQSMSKITVPFLPKIRLMEYLQTQCQVDADSPRGAFNGALDLDLSHIDACAAVDRVAITDVQITPESVLVSYDVHYGIFNGCKGVDVTSYLDKKVAGRRSVEGWQFSKFVMPPQRSTADEF
jgi:hypothetical protein